MHSHISLSGEKTFKEKRNGVKSWEHVFRAFSWVRMRWNQTKRVAKPSLIASESLLMPYCRSSRWSVK